MTEWTDHVKKVASEKGISYKEAMKIAKDSYKKDIKPVEPVKSEDVKPPPSPQVDPLIKLIEHAMPPVEKKKRVKGKGLKTKILDEDVGGLQHIYPLSHDKVVSMA